MDEDVLPEKDLLERISRNDKAAFRRLFARYKDRFYAAALKMTHSSQEAEDIVQEVFISLWKRRVHLREVKNPHSYLFSIVYNIIARHFKQLSVEKMMKAELREQTVASENTTELFLEEKENRQWLQKIINRLPTQQQVIYHLSKEEGLSRKEIAERLEISPNTVKNHLLKAMKFVKKHYLRGTFMLTLFLLL